LIMVIFISWLLQTQTQGCLWIKLLKKTAFVSMLLIDPICFLNLPHPHLPPSVHSTKASVS
jgi:hypothetical protein